MTEQQDERLRAQARRAFVRQNHPDVGGDPHVFRAGLTAFDGSAPSRPVPLLGRLARIAGARIHEVKEAFVDGYNHPDEPTT